MHRNSRQVRTLIIALTVSTLSQITVPQATWAQEGLDGSGAALDGGIPALTYATSPVPVERGTPVAFTMPNGEQHWFEPVYLPEGGINWVQAKLLAEEAGGYLATLHSEAENAFVFSLIADLKYWHRFDKPYNDWILSGPFLGGFQPAGAAEPDGGWQWVSGEPWSYERWQKEGLDIGNIFPPDNQPNNNNDNQNVLAFGEVDYPVAYWSDVPHKMSTYNTPAPPNFGFVIEYNAEPAS